MGKVVDEWGNGNQIDEPLNNIGGTSIRPGHVCTNTSNARRCAMPINGLLLSTSAVEVVSIKSLRMDIKLKVLFVRGYDGSGCSHRDHQENVNLFLLVLHTYHNHKSLPKNKNATPTSPIALEVRNIKLYAVYIIELSVSPGKFYSFKYLHERKKKNIVLSSHVHDLHPMYASPFYHFSHSSAQLPPWDWEHKLQLVYNSCLVFRFSCS
ncbi:unnamed protein product [Amoebophrya sp. A120]|nr:unnamed protein product [Amoebophrya sp. A120]|eukprot:GSA120T00001465001.1